MYPERGRARSRGPCPVPGENGTGSCPEGVHEREVSVGSKARFKMTGNKIIS